MDLDLKSHVVVITGGSSGIGHATAQQFLSEGAKVVVWDLQSPENDLVSFQYVDITSGEDVAQAMSATISEFGRIDHLVHAAAIGSGSLGFPSTTSHPKIGRVCWK